MWTLLAVLALATGALARNQFIVGGDDVDIANFPWQGSYMTNLGSHTCGCVFVGGSWVLTAGHCGGSSGYYTVFGHANRGLGIEFKVSAITRHPDYGTGPGFTPNDIAVVQSETAISGTNISPATMAANATNPGGNGWITGWGRTCGFCPLPLMLQGTEIPIISDAECSERWGDQFQDTNMICVFGGQDGGIGACNGDSGGPLTVGSTLYGLTSWGSNGCDTNSPSVYNKVGAFNDWVCGETDNGAQGCTR